MKVSLDWLVKHHLFNYHVSSMLWGERIWKLMMWTLDFFTSPLTGLSLTMRCEVPKSAEHKRTTLQTSTWVSILNKTLPRHQHMFLYMKTGFISNVLHSVYVRYLSGTRRRRRRANLRNRGVFSVRVNVHMTSGSRGAGAFGHKEDVSSFYRLLKAWCVKIDFLYRWADLCRSRLIVCTVRCHSYPRAHTQCPSCWYTGVKRQESYQGRMTTWFCWGIGRVTVYGDENVSEIVQTLHFPC